MCPAGCSTEGRPPGEPPAERSHMTFATRVVLWSVGSGLLVACGFLPPALDRAEAEQDSKVVLSWSRQGGFAGFCEELKLTASGHATASSCTVTGVKSRELSTDDLKRLNRWRAVFGSVTITSNDAATADAMTLKLTLVGKGRSQPSET